MQRLGLYAQDAWRATSHLTVNYGMRYDTSFGLLTASGRSQGDNPVFLTLKALQIPLIPGVPRDYHKAFGPRLGVAYSPGQSGTTVIRAGFGLFYDDLAQGGWVTALQAVNAPPGPCVNPGDPGCVSAGNIIDSNYKTPYALHASAGVEHAFSPNWTMAADYTHEQGNHSYRAYNYLAGFTLFSPNPANQPLVPNVSVFKSDNRSSYNALFIHLQGNVSRRFNLVANYTLSRAKTWGCVLGELFDYVNGVCNPLNAFGPGDYGPSGEDVTHRFVLAGTFYVPGWFRAHDHHPGGERPPFYAHHAGRRKRVWRFCQQSRRDQRTCRPRSTSSAGLLTFRPTCELAGRSNSKSAGRLYRSWSSSISSIVTIPERITLPTYRFFPSTIFPTSPGSVQARWAVLRPGSRPSPALSSCSSHRAHWEISSVRVRPSAFRSRLSWACALLFECVALGILGIKEVYEERAYRTSHSVTRCSWLSTAL